MSEPNQESSKHDQITDWNDNVSQNHIKVQIPQRITELDEDDLSDGHQDNGNSVNKQKNKFRRKYRGEKINTSLPTELSPIKHFGSFDSKIEINPKKRGDLIQIQESGQTNEQKINDTPQTTDFDPNPENQKNQPLSQRKTTTKRVINNQSGILQN